MALFKDVSNVLGSNEITSIVSILALIISIVSFFSNILVKSPIERLFKTSLTLFLDYLIKSVFGSVIVISAISFLGQQVNLLSRIKDTETIATTMASIFMGTLLIFMLGVFQYLWFTSKKKTNFKFLRWVVSVTVFFVVLLGAGIISGYFWSINNTGPTLIYMGVSVLLMSFVISGLNQELSLIHKDRPRYVLRMTGKTDVSSLSTREVFHTQTITKEAQIFEPPSNHNDNASKTYYVFYPREQVALKYTWDKE